MTQGRVGLLKMRNRRLQQSVSDCCHSPIGTTAYMQHYSIFLSLSPPPPPPPLSSLRITRTHKDSM